MKLVLIIVILILAIIGVSTLYKGMKLDHTLVTYNGRVCSYWEARLWPDEYIHGWVVKSAKLSPRIDIRTGMNSGVTPIQGAELIDYLLETYPVTSHGASLESIDRSYDQENRQSTIIFRFSKAPSKKGITQTALQKIIDELLANYEYIYADKWPLDPQKCIDVNEERAKRFVLNDMARKGI